LAAFSSSVPSASMLLSSCTQAQPAEPWYMT
jgi:hypothetical protein